MATSWRAMLQLYMLLGFPSIKTIILGEARVWVEEGCGRLSQARCKDAEMTV